MISAYLRRILPLMTLADNMTSRQWLILSCFACICMISCQSTPHAYQVLDGQAQGTTFHIVYKDELNRDFSLSVDSLFQVMDQSMSLWLEGSVIKRINDNDPDIVPDPHFIQVFQQAQEIAQATDGALDVTIGPLVNVWKIDAANDLPLPDSSVVDSILTFTGYTKVRLEEDRLLKEDPRIQLDFNAIAQGYTVDLICSYFDQQNISHYLVEVGGEVRVKGVNPDNKHWQIGIDKPVESTAWRMLQTSLSLDNRSLATSGSYRKYREHAGKKLSHVINPKTGYPANHSLLSVSVVADDCASADGYATAFLVMGLERTMRFAEENRIPVYCIYADEEGEFAICATPDFPK